MNLDLVDKVKKRRKSSVTLLAIYLISYIVPNPFLFKEPFTSYGFPAPVIVAEYYFQSIGKVPAEPSYMIFWIGLAINTVFWLLGGATMIYTYNKINSRGEEK